MSQEQPRRGDQRREPPIKYGEVFNVSGELATKPVTPRDAALMQSAESRVLGGQIQKGSPAAVMESAARKNERAGHVSHEAATRIARNQGVSVSVADDGAVTETLGGQVLGKFVKAEDVVKGSNAVGSGVNELGVTYSASVQAPPQVRATGENDFISNHQQGDNTSLNPRLSAANQEDHENNNTHSNVSTDEDPEIINSVPGGMGASMATADRFKKNK